MATKRFGKSVEIGASELEERVLFVNRCSKVVKGGIGSAFVPIEMPSCRSGRISQLF